MKRSSASGPVAAPRVQDLLDSPFAWRKFDRELEVCETSRRVLSFCRYRRAREHYCYARPSSRPDALGIRRRHTSIFAIDLAHPLRWHEEVYRRGLSGASSCLVFGAGWRRRHRARRPAGQGLLAAARLRPGAKGAGPLAIGMGRAAGRVQPPVNRSARGR